MGTDKIGLVEDPGLYVLGTYLGIKPAGTWTPPGESQAVDVPAKLGIGVDDDREVAIVIDGPEDMAVIAPGAAKGDTIAVPVRVFAQRNGRGVRYVWAHRRGMGDAATGWT